MEYCKKCLYPSTKPDLKFNEEGVCSACTCYENRKIIDWEKRERDFINIMEKHRSKDGSNYDCLIPISGGKDSTYQVWKILKLGYNPLCVYATTCSISELGRKNIENIKNRFNVDVLELSTNKKIRVQLNKYCLENLGDISWPEHVAIFTVPFQIAVKYNISLIIWGESPQNEYGAVGSVGGDSNILDRKWMEEYGGFCGFRINDIKEILDLSHNKILPFIYPTDKEIRENKIQGLFLGYYFNWDEYRNYLISSANGFTTTEKKCENSIVNYCNLDCYYTGIHDYFKYLKYGFGRVSDHLSMYIRRGLISRKDSVNLLDSDGVYPKTYLGKKLEEILSELNISIDKFNEICDNYTNKSIFKYDENKKDFVRRKDGSPELKKNI
jgi:N-acetyl sugar amidotransferase